MITFGSTVRTPRGIGVVIDKIEIAQEVKYVVGFDYNDSESFWESELVYVIKSLNGGEKK